MTEGATDPAAAPIGSHRLLSSGCSLALLTSSAEINWWCAPDLDSPPVLWSLLDPTGGSARWVDAEVANADGVPAGPVLETGVRIAGVRICCRDALLDTAGGPTIVRLVRTTAGSARIVHHLAVPATHPWPGSTDTQSQLTVRRLGGDSGSQRASSGGSVPVTASADRWTGVVIAQGAVTATATALTGDWVSAVDDADRQAAEVARAARLPRHHPDRAADALAVLRACTFEPTGALAASATTSLPEAPGGDRQFDYRYCWVRDAGLAASVASLLGQRHVARRYLAFVCSAWNGDPRTAPAVLDVRGDPVPAERIVGGVRGWRASRPVRVGNAAADQLQYDAWGILVEAVSVHVQTGGTLSGTTWSLVRRIADHVATSRAEPSNGIWELRDERPLLSGDIGRWLVLDRALWLARGWRPWTRRRHWKQTRAEIRERILSAIDGDGRLPQSYGSSTPDASALMTVLFGLLDSRDRRAGLVVDTIIADLEASPFLYRYPPGSDDGFAGREGAFLPVSWWAVAALAKIGRLPEARSRLDELCGRLPRLLSEQIDPVSGESLGNVPLVWSHMELARALYLLDAAAIRHRWGRAGLWVWRLARYFRLRWARQ